MGNLIAGQIIDAYSKVFPGQLNPYDSIIVIVDRYPHTPASLFAYQISHFPHKPPGNKIVDDVGDGGLLQFRFLGKIRPRTHALFPQKPDQQRPVHLLHIFLIKSMVNHIHIRPSFFVIV